MLANLGSSLANAGQIGRSSAILEGCGNVGMLFASVCQSWSNLAQCKPTLAKLEFGQRRPTNGPNRAIVSQCVSHAANICPRRFNIGPNVEELGQLCVRQHRLNSPYMFAHRAQIQRPEVNRKDFPIFCGLSVQDLCVLSRRRMTELRLDDDQRHRRFWARRGRVLRSNGRLQDSLGRINKRRCHRCSQFRADPADRFGTGPRSRPKELVMLASFGGTHPSGSRVRVPPPPPSTQSWSAANTFRKERLFGNIRNGLGKAGFG